MPRDLVIAIDEYAREYRIRMSDVVRSAVEEYLAASGWVAAPTLYGSTHNASLILNSPEARISDETRGGVQTETFVDLDRELLTA